MIDAQKGMLGGKPMRAITVGGEIYVCEDDARHAVKAALATNAARNTRIAELEAALAKVEAERDALKEDAERLRGYAEELAEGLADFIEFFHNYQGQKREDANAALRAYRAAYPKEPTR